MSNRSQISVTLSDELLHHLRIQAQRLHVPLKWLVAGLVVDTSEPAFPRAARDDRMGCLHRCAGPAV